VVQRNVRQHHGFRLRRRSGIVAGAQARLHHRPREPGAAEHLECAGGQQLELGRRDGMLVRDLDDPTDRVGELLLGYGATVDHNPLGVREDVG
jgi:hypothetical protein